MFSDAEDVHAPAGVFDREEHAGLRVADAVDLEEVRGPDVPVALLVYVVLQLLASPLMNIVSRHEEAEADWSSLRATRNPAAERSLFRKLATTSLANPDPPAWSYVLYADHPTIVQRIAMVDAWQARNAR